MSLSEQDSLQSELADAESSHWLQTQHKLQDVRGAAITAGIPGLSVVHNTITTGKGIYGISAYDIQFKLLRVKISLTEE